MWLALSGLFEKRKLSRLYQSSDGKSTVTRSEKELHSKYKNEPPNGEQDGDLDRG